VVIKAGTWTQLIPDKPDLLAEVGFGVVAEVAIATLRHIQWNDMVTWTTHHSNSYNQRGTEHILSLMMIIFSE